MSTRPMFRRKEHSWRLSQEVGLKKFTAPEGVRGGPGGPVWAAWGACLGVRALRTCALATRPLAAARAPAPPRPLATRRYDCRPMWQPGRSPRPPGQGIPRPPRLLQSRLAASRFHELRKPYEFMGFAIMTLNIFYKHMVSEHHDVTHTNLNAFSEIVDFAATVPRGLRTVSFDLQPRI